MSEQLCWSVACYLIWLICLTEILPTYGSISDLDPDDGRFHGQNESVFHNGFDRAALRRALAEAGFDEIRDRTAATMVKPVPDGSSLAFTVFLMIGRKVPDRALQNFSAPGRNPLSP